MSFYETIYTTSWQKNWIMNIIYVKKSVAKIIMFTHWIEYKINFCLNDISDC